MSLRSEKFPDERQLKDIDLEELIRRARAGTLMTGHGALLELRRWRGYLLGQAEDLIAGAITESRALSIDQVRAVDRHIADAKELGPVIEELDAAMRKELADPRNLIPISPRY